MTEIVVVKRGSRIGIVDVVGTMCKLDLCFGNYMLQNKSWGIFI